MGWRETFERRERRRALEDRDLPPSMRQGSQVKSRLPTLLMVAALLWLLVRFLMTILRAGEIEGFWILVGMVAVAALIAVRVAREHRSKGRKQLRKEPEANSVDWDDA